MHRATVGRDVGLHPDSAFVYPGGSPAPARAAISVAISVPLDAAQRRSMPVIHEEKWGGLRGLSPQASEPQSGGSIASTRASNDPAARCREVPLGTSKQPVREGKLAGEEGFEPSIP